MAAKKKQIDQVISKNKFKFLFLISEYGCGICELIEKWFSAFKEGVSMSKFYFQSSVSFEGSIDVSENFESLQQ